MYCNIPSAYIPGDMAISRVRGAVWGNCGDQPSLIGPPCLGLDFSCNQPHTLILTLAHLEAVLYHLSSGLPIDLPPLDVMSHDQTHDCGRDHAQGQTTNGHHSGTTVEMMRAAQGPLKASYREDPSAAIVTLKSSGYVPVVGWCGPADTSDQQDSQRPKHLLLSRRTKRISDPFRSQKGRRVAS